MRGLTWALYGFGTAYTFTHDERFLDTAQRCADFYIARTPAHGVPPNDWEEPNPIQPYESSAAVIAASGLLQLAEITREPERADHYRCRRRGSGDSSGSADRSIRRTALCQ